MPRAIWTGTISFGLVTVPVKLYSATSSKTVRFNQLSADTGGRIQQKRIDSTTGEEVPYEKIVKGYELATDRYVVIEPAELEALEPRKTKTIDILDFVESEQIDPIYYDHPYYLAPGTGGAKPYRLLMEAMRATGRVGIATVVIRQKESLVALRPEGEVMGMSTMRFADEVLDPAQLDELEAVREVKVDKRELDIAKQLVESLAAGFDPGKYSDSYRARVLELIERKAAGEEIAVQPGPSEEPAPVPDLMAALKASLDAVRAGDRADDGTAARKPAAKAAAKKKRAANAAASRPRAKTAKTPAKTKR